MLSHGILMGVVLTLGADGSGNVVLPASADPPTSVYQALRHNALDGFAGTVSFLKEMWVWPSPAGGRVGNAGYVRQKWTIATDGPNRIRATLAWLEGDNVVDVVHVGRNPDRMWVTIGHELLICEQQALGEMADSLSPTAAGIMQSMARAAFGELDSLLAAGGRARNGACHELLSFVDRDPNRLGAVMKIDGDINTVTFHSIDDQLFPATIVRDDGETTWQWKFDGYHKVDGRWIPAGTELQGRGANGKSSLDVYSQILISPAADRREFQNKFSPPKPSEPGAEHITSVQMFSETGLTIRSFGE